MISLIILFAITLSSPETMERQVNKWKANDQDYLNAVAAGDTEKARGLENMIWLCARESVFEAMVCDAI